MHKYKYRAGEVSSAVADMDAGRDGVGRSGNASHSCSRGNHSHRNTAEQNQRLERY